MNPRLRLIILVSSLVVVSALVIASCGVLGGGEEVPEVVPETTEQTDATPVPKPTPVPPPDPVYGGTLRIPIVRDAKSFDAAATARPEILQLTAPLSNWLVASSEAVGIQPDLAQTWSVSSDGKVHTFNLDEAALWHDGTPVTAFDVKATLDRVAFGDELSAGPYRDHFRTLTSIDAPNPTTVEMVSATANPAMLKILGQAGLTIFPETRPASSWDLSRPGSVVGSGPFTFEQHTASQSISLDSNVSYWRRDAQGNQIPYLDGVELRIISDTTVERAAFEAGQIDLTNPHFPSRVQGIESALAQRFPDSSSSVSHGSWAFLLPSPAVEPYGNVSVRKALSLALDRQAWAREATEGRGAIRGLSTPGTAFAPTFEEILLWAGYGVETKHDDMTAGSALLTSAAIDPATLDAEVLTLSAAERQVGTAVKLLNRSLGTAFAVKVVSDLDWVRAVETGSWTMLGGVSVSTFADPASELDAYLRTSARFNRAGLSEPAIDAALDAIATAGAEERAGLAKELERQVLVDEARWIVLGSVPTTHAWRGWVRNYSGFTLSQEGPYQRHEQTWLDDGS